jgi:hypothetical protein
MLGDADGQHEQNTGSLDVGQRWENLKPNDGHTSRGFFHHSSEPTRMARQQKCRQTENSTHTNVKHYRVHTITRVYTVDILDILICEINKGKQAG